MSVDESAVGRIGIAVDGQRNRVAEGRIIAHSIVPQVCIEAIDGTRTWWRHDMVRIAAVDELEAMVIDAHEQAKRERP